MNPRVVITLQVLGVVFCVLALAGSFAMSFQTWVAIGTLAGFGALAVAMPLCVDGHVMTALTTWLSPVSEQLARFARANLYAVGAASVMAQSTYHAVITWQGHGPTVPHNAPLTVLALGAGAFPPVVATLAVHLAVGIVREAFTTAEVSDASSQQPTRSQTPVETAPLLPAAANPAPPEIRPSVGIASPLRAASKVQPSPDAVSSPAPLPAASAGLAAVPPLSAELSAQQSVPARRVTVEDVRALAHLGRVEIAGVLGTSVATVDRRLRELRSRQAVPA